MISQADILSNLTHVMTALMVLTSAVSFSTTGAHASSDERILKLNSMIEQDPNNAALLMSRAYENLGKGKEYALAKRDLNRVKALGVDEANSAEFNYLQGLYHQATKRSMHANNYFKTCTKLDLKRAACFREWAKNLVGVSDFRGAIKVYSRLIVTSPAAKPRDYQLLAELLASKQVQQQQQALIILDQAQRRFGSRSHLEQAAVRIEVQRKNFAGALQRHQTLEGLLGKSPRWHFEKAVLLQHLGEDAEAKLAYQLALDMISSERVLKHSTSARLAQQIQTKLASLNI